MNEIVTESSHAKCELCRILKTVRMTEQSADSRRNHRLLLDMLTCVSVSQGSRCSRTEKTAERINAAADASLRRRRKKWRWCTVGLVRPSREAPSHNLALGHSQF